MRYRVLQFFAADLITEQKQADEFFVDRKQIVLFSFSNAQLNAVSKMRAFFT